MFKARLAILTVLTLSSLNAFAEIKNNPNVPSNGCGEGVINSVSLSNSHGEPGDYRVTVNYGTDCELRFTGEHVVLGANLQNAVGKYLKLGAQETKLTSGPALRFSNYTVTDR